MSRGEAQLSKEIQMSARSHSPFLSILLLWATTSPLLAQLTETREARPYQEIARQIVTTGLASGIAYEMLHELTAIGPRLSGSAEAAKAVNWAKKKMEVLGFENVRFQPVMVPHWVRGPVEEAYVVNSPSKGHVRVGVCALGGSIATPEDGITAEVVEVRSFEELRDLGEKARGKIIFFNRPMDPSKIRPGDAYDSAVNQRKRGAIEAAKVGAVAALVRSMTMRLDDVPHTGAMSYVDTVPKVPAAAISTIGADFLSGLLKKEEAVTVLLRLSCYTLPDVPSANVIGELIGTEKPNEIVLIGAHLDSWDKGTGAHDDGAGCVHAIEAIRLLKELGLRPKRTIRAVLFMNEENGKRGARRYTARDRPGEKHVAAIYSDAGGFSPRGFAVAADSVTITNTGRWAYVFEPIGADRITRGDVWGDLIPLVDKGVPAIVLRVDEQRYFDYHHSDNDTIDKVNQRELELGAAAMAILAFVLAEEGL